MILYNIFRNSDAEVEFEQITEVHAHLLPDL